MSHDARECGVLPPRHSPEALPGAGGCILPVGHLGDHIDKIGDSYWRWGDDWGCGCCTPEEGDRCFNFGEIATLSPDPVLLGEVREAIERALQCTPGIKPEYVGLAGLTYRSVIEYDCGDPWQILRDLLAKLPKLTG